MSTKKPVNVPALTPFQRAGLTLMPLRKWDAKTKDGKPAGKLPLKGWRTKDFKAAAVIARAKRDRHNVGVRIGDRWLVLDFDVRHAFGDDELELVCKKFGMARDACPEVITGSNGRHLYLRIPKGFRCRNTIPGFDAVECKAEGRFVVAPGSIHPNGKPYHWVEDRPPLADAPQAPKALLAAIARPEPKADFAPDSARITPEQLATMLASLPPEDFGTNDAWEPLMMAAHHATGGAGMAEFIEWSISDPAFADAAPAIESRWNSLDADKIGGRTLRSLQAAVAKYDPNATVAGDAAADFDDDEDVPEDDSWLEGEDFEPSSDDDCGALERLNRTHCAVSAGGKYRIRYVEEDAVGKAWQQISRQDFLALKESAPKLQTEGDKLISLGLAWQQWPHRRTAKGLTFDSKLPPASLDQYGNLNLWLGWTVPPKKGEWRKFKAMIRDDICDGDEKVFIYVVNWIAWKYQNPGELPKVAIAMRGSKGTGKGTFAEAIMRPFGNQAMATADYNLIAGRFTGHLEDKVMLFADEAFWAGDPRQESKIKKLITDRHTTYEDKGIKAYTGINRVGLIFATNEDWVVPAGEGERRYCVLRTSDRHQCPEGEPDHANRAYWDAIHAELENGGLAAFVHDMLNWPLPKGWHPQAHVPITKELANQKALSLRGVAAYYFEKLQAGALDDSLHLDGPDVEWERGALHVRPTAVWEDARAWLHVTNPRAVITVKAVANELKKFGWQIADHQRLGKHRDRYWLCPDLKNARKRFNQVMRGEFF